MILIAVGEENGLIDIAIAVGPEWIVVPVVPWPQRHVKEVAEGERPEPGSDPAEMEEVIAMPPSVMPAIVPERLECYFVGEGAAHAEIVRIGGMFERRDMRVQVFALIGRQRIGMVQIGMIEFAVIRSVGVNPGCVGRVPIITRDMAVIAVRAAPVMRSVR